MMSRAIPIVLASMLVASVVVVRAQEQRARGQRGQQPQEVSIEDWPEVAKTAYKEMEAKYGAPDEVTPTRLIEIARRAGFEAWLAS